MVSRARKRGLVVMAKIALVEYRWGGYSHRQFVKNWFINIPEEKTFFYRQLALLIKGNYREYGH